MDQLNPPPLPPFPPGGAGEWTRHLHPGVLRSGHIQVGEPEERRGGGGQGAGMTHERRIGYGITTPQHCDGIALCCSLFTRQDK